MVIKNPYDGNFNQVILTAHTMVNVFVTFCPDIR